MPFPSMLGHKVALPNALTALHRHPKFVHETFASQQARHALAVIGISLLIRCTFCQMGDLGIDESYTVVQSRHLQLSYFDHPPLHYWIAHGAVALFGENRLARLPFVI